MARLQAAPGVSALRLGGVAGLGREPAGRTARRRRRRSAGLVLIAFAAWLHGLVRRRVRGSDAAWRRWLALALVVVAVALGVLAGPGAAARASGPSRRRARAGSRSARSAWPSCAPRAAPSSSTSRPRGASRVSSTSAWRSAHPRSRTPSPARAWSCSRPTGPTRSDHHAGARIVRAQRRAALSPVPGRRRPPASPRCFRRS